MVLENEDGSLEIYESTGGTTINLSLYDDGINMAHALKNVRTGEGLPDVILNHAIHYGKWGDVEHRLALVVNKPIKNLRRLSPVVLKTTDKSLAEIVLEVDVRESAAWLQRRPEERGAFLVLAPIAVLAASYVRRLSTSRCWGSCCRSLLRKRPGA